MMIAWRIRQSGFGTPLTPKPRNELYSLSVKGLRRPFRVLFILFYFFSILYFFEIQSSLLF